MAVVAPAQGAAGESEVKLVEVGCQVGVHVDSNREHGADAETDSEGRDTEHSQTAGRVSDLVPLDAVEQFAADDVAPRRKIIQRRLGGANVRGEQALSGRRR